MLCSIETEILTNYSIQSGFYFDNIRRYAFTQTAKVVNLETKTSQKVKTLLNRKSPFSFILEIFVYKHQDKDAFHCIDIY